MYLTGNRSCRLLILQVKYKGVYYYRSGSTNQKLTGLELESFLLRKQGATWDNLPLPSFTMSDVDNGVIKRFIKWASKKGRIDESDSELRYQDEIHGSLLDQIDRIIDTVHLKYMKAKITYEGIQRIERYFVPDAALREALLNALCHKDYARGIPIQVSVYNDRLYIANCGRLPENWSAEKLMEKHSSEPFNPNIAHVYYLAGFIESWGRGIEKICDACREDNVPLPEYDITGNSVMIKFIAPEDRIVYGPGEFSSRTVNRTVNRTVKLAEDERQILELLLEDPGYTYQVIADKLNIGRTSVSERIRKLKEKGILERIGSAKNGYWKIME